MENNDTIKEIEVSRTRMILKILKLLFFSIIRLRFYIPGIPEIKVDELNNLINSDQSPLILDTRDAIEFYGRGGMGEICGHIPNAKLLPIFQFTPNLVHLSSFKNKAIVTICPGGGTSLIACEIMLNAGFTNVKSLRGGMNKWNKKRYPTTKAEEPEDSIYRIEDANMEPLWGESELVDGKYNGEVDKTLDARNLSCPKPVLMSKKTMGKLEIGQILEILTTDPGSKRDIPAWAKVTGQELVSAEDNSPNEFRFIVKKSIK